MSLQDKCICCDDISKKFLISLERERLKKGLSRQELASMLGVHVQTVSCYERGKHLPKLHTLMKLAEIFGYDLSSSINYKYYHGQIDSETIKRRLRFYGLSNEGIGNLIGYTHDSIYKALNFADDISLDCLNAILEVIDEERERLNTSVSC